MVTKTLPRAEPWWERSQVPWRGAFFDRMTLRPEDPAERRIQRLREETVQRRRGGRLSIERARLVTESYRETEGEHPAIRRALALARVLEYIPIPLAPGQLLIGTPTSGLDAIEIFVEFLHIWYSEEGYDSDQESRGRSLRGRAGSRVAVAEEDERRWENEIWPYWRDRTRGALAVKEMQRNFPQSLDYARNAGVCVPLLDGPLYHTVQDYRSVVEKGLNGLKAEIREHMAGINPASPASMEEIERYNNYQALLIVADGMIRYAERCAELAEQLAAAEQDPTRAAELREMARISRKVPAEPAESWWEALQSAHLMHMATPLLEGGGSHSMGRLDLYLYPYLQRDLESGRITKKQAQELLECFFLKFGEAHSYTQVGSSPGSGRQDKINLGGIDAYGRDVTNELSYMLLEAHAHVHLNDPNLAVRLHRHTPDDFLRSTLEVLRLGGGLPILISDEVIVPGLVSVGGVELEHARHYADLGCQENVTDPNMTGADTNGHTNAGWFSLPKIVELTLHNGVNPLNGQQVGPRTGDPRTFQSMEQFMEAYRQQLEHAAAMDAIAMNVAEYTFVRYFPCVYHNLMHPGPRRTGVDVNGGGCRYNWTGSLGVGLANMGDSLAAIDKLIFQEKSATWDELLAALAANWEGYEELRRRCIAAPKYGTDDDYADAWTKRGVDIYFDAFERLRTAKGGRFVGGLISMASFMTLGLMAGATPDGRRAKEMLADSTSPSSYAPALGPTAAHRSIMKAVDAYHCVNGVTFNQKFNMSSLLSDRDVSKWMDLVRGYVEGGGQEVQYTVVDRKTLVDAQRNPDRYRDLIVRVGGYSAAFVDLTKELQDAVIARAEQEV